MILVNFQVFGLHIIDLSFNFYLVIVLPIEGWQGNCDGPFRYTGLGIRGQMSWGSWCGWDKSIGPLVWWRFLDAEDDGGTDGVGMIPVKHSLMKFIYISYVA